MAVSVDERVVSMRFDNRRFEQNARETLTTLQQMRSALAMEGTVDKVDYAMDKIIARFSMMGTIADQMTRNVTNTVYGAITKTVGFIPSLLTKAVSQAKTGGMARAMKIAKAKFSLEGLGVNWEAIYDDIDYAVAGTAYGLDAAANAAAQMVASGVALGDDMKAALRGISGVAAQTSSSYEDIANVFTRVAGNGRLMAIDLQSLSSRGMNAAAQLGNVLGKTEGEIREMVSKGQISFDIFAKAMDDAFGEHAKDANKTFDGAMSNMKAALNKIGADFASPFLEEATDVFNFLRETLNDVRKTLKIVIFDVTNLMKVVKTKIGKFLNLRNMKLISLIINSIWKSIKNFAKGFQTVMNPVIKAFRDWFPKITSLDIAKWAVDLMHLTDNLGYNEKAQVGLYKVTKILLAPLKGLANIFSWIVQSAGKLVSWIGKISGAFYEMVADMEIPTSFQEFFGDERYSRVLDALGKIIDRNVGYFKYFKEVLDSLVKKFTELPAINKILQTMSDIMNNFKERSLDAFVWALELIANFDPVASAKRIGEALKNMQIYYESLFGQVLGRFRDSVRSFIIEIKNFADTHSLMETLAFAADKTAMWLIDVLKILSDGIKSFITNLQPSSVVIYAYAIMMIKIMNILAEAILAGSNFIAGITGIGNSIKKFFTTLSNQALAATPPAVLLMVTMSIYNLAMAISVLIQTTRDLENEEIARAILILAVLGVTMAALMTGVEKASAWAGLTGKRIIAVGIAFGGLAAGLSLLIGAITALAPFLTGEKRKDLIDSGWTLVAYIFVLSIAMAAAIGLMALISHGNKAPARVASACVGMSVAIGMISGIIVLLAKTLGHLDVKYVNQALGIVGKIAAGMLIFISLVSLFTGLTSLMSGGVVGGGITKFAKFIKSIFQMFVYLKMVAALTTLISGTVRAIAGLVLIVAAIGSLVAYVPLGGVVISAGLAALTIITVLFAGLLVVVASCAPTAVKAAVASSAMVLALIGLSACVYMLSTISQEDFIRAGKNLGILAIALFGSVVLLMRLIGAVGLLFATNMAVMIGIVSGAMWLLTKAMKNMAILAKDGYGFITEASVWLIALMFALTWTTHLITKLIASNIQQSKRIALVFLSLAASIALITMSLMFIKDVPAGRLFTGLVGISLLVAAFLGMMTVMSRFSTSNNPFNNMYTSKSIIAIGTIVAAIVGVVALLTTLIPRNDANARFVWVQTFYEIILGVSGLMIAIGWMFRLVLRNSKTITPSVLGAFALVLGLFYGVYELVKLLIQPSINQTQLIIAGGIILAIGIMFSFIGYGLGIIIKSMKGVKDVGKQLKQWGIGIAAALGGIAAILVPIALMSVFANLKTFKMVVTTLGIVSGLIISLLIFFGITINILKQNTSSIPSTTKHLQGVMFGIAVIFGAIATILVPITLMSIFAKSSTLGTVIASMTGMVMSIALLMTGLVFLVKQLGSGTFKPSALKAMPFVLYSLATVLVAIGVAFGLILGMIGGFKLNESYLQTVLGTLSLLTVTIVAMFLGLTYLVDTVAKSKIKPAALNSTAILLGSASLFIMSIAGAISLVAFNIWSLDAQQMAELIVALVSVTAVMFLGLYTLMQGIHQYHIKPKDLALLSASIFVASLSVMIIAGAISLIAYNIRDISVFDIALSVMAILGVVLGGLLLLVLVVKKTNANIGDVLSAAGAIAGASASLLIIALSLQWLNDVDLEGLSEKVNNAIKLFAAVAIATAILAAISATGVGMAGILVAAAAMVAIGFAIKLMGQGISDMSAGMTTFINDLKSFIQELIKIDWKKAADQVQGMLDVGEVFNKFVITMSKAESGLVTLEKFSDRLTKVGSELEKAAEAITTSMREINNRLEGRVGVLGNVRNGPNTGKTPIFETVSQSIKDEADAIVHESARQERKVFNAAARLGKMNELGYREGMDWHSPPPWSLESIQDTVGGIVDELANNEILVEFATEHFGESMVNGFKNAIDNGDYSGLAKEVGSRLVTAITGLDFSQYSGIIEGDIGTIFGDEFLKEWVISDALANMDTVVEDAVDSVEDLVDVEEILEDQTYDTNEALEEQIDKLINISDYAKDTSYILQNQLESLGYFTATAEEWGLGAEDAEYHFMFAQNAVMKFAESLYDAKVAAGEAEFIDESEVNGVAKRLAAVKSAYLEVYNSIKDTVKSQMDIFSEYEVGEEIDPETLIKNMESQLSGVTTWSNNLATLAGKGLSSELLQYLAELGPESASYVNAFMVMTEEQLKNADRLYSNSLKLPTAVADEMMASMVTASVMQAEEAKREAAEAGRSVLTGFEIGLGDDGIWRRIESESGELGRAVINSLYSSMENVIAEKNAEVKEDISNETTTAIEEGLEEGASNVDTTAASNYVKEATYQAVDDMWSRADRAYALNEEKGEELAQDMVDTYVDTFREAAENEQLQETIDEIIEDFGERGEEIPEEFVEGILKYARSDLMNRPFGEFVSKSDKELIKALSTLEKTAEKEGTSVAKQFIKGLKDSTISSKESSDLAIAVKKLCEKNIVKAAKEALKIKSPSRVAYGIGGYFIEGLANSIDEGAKVVGNSVKNLGSGMETALASAMAIDPETQLDDVVSLLSQAFSQIADAVNSDLITNPVISPVLNLDNLYYGIENANGLLGGLNTSYGYAHALNAMTVPNGDGTFKMGVNRYGYDQNGEALGQPIFDNTDVVAAINSLYGDIENLAMTMRNLQIVMDTGALVGSVQSPIDAALGVVAARNRREKV